MRYESYASSAQVINPAECVSPIQSPYPFPSCSLPGELISLYLPSISMYRLHEREAENRLQVQKFKAELRDFELKKTVELRKAKVEVEVAKEVSAWVDGWVGE